MSKKNDDEVLPAVGANEELTMVKGNPRNPKSTIKLDYV